MKTMTELEELYESELKPKLASLEDMRKKVMHGFILAAFLFGGAIAALFIFNSKGSTGLATPFNIGLIVVLIAGIVFFILTISKQKKYRSEYKSRVVKEIVKMINPEWIYAPDQMISTQDYMQSDLFRRHYDRYKGDDFISGKIDKTDFRCSELHTEYKTTTTDSKGNTKQTWHTIFKGLFFHADFNKSFSGQTYVTPDIAEKMFGKWGQKLQKHSGNGALIKLENPVFEKEFVVHASDPIEARYIITPTMMEAMLAIKDKYKRPVHFSFTGTRVFCAMSFDKDLFEPNIFSSGVKFADVEAMYKLFMLNETIIKELNLNTRIWTKE